MQVKATNFLNQV